MDTNNPYSNKSLPESTERRAPTYVQSPTSQAIIPYRNPKALIAYYLGIFSGFPLIGLPIGIAAFVFGIQGLQNRKKDPSIKGSVHAWIGIGCGGFFAVLWLFLTIVLVTVMVLAPK